MKVLITGAQGMLGKDLVEIFSVSEYQVIPAGRRDVDITDRQVVNNFIDYHKPDVVINAAAYNAVDDIEQDNCFELAMQVNGKAPGYLADAAKRAGARFVHFSTEYVFDGKTDQGYTEDALPNPISRYGMSKYEGEKHVQVAGGDWFICRVSKLFGKPGLSDQAKESVVSLMLRLAKEKNELHVVDEEYGGPTYTLDVARAVLELVKGGYKPGVYHLVNEGEPVSVHGFVKEIFACRQVKTVVHPVSRRAFPRAAKCPAFAPLINTKAPKLRDRKAALEDFLG